MLSPKNFFLIDGIGAAFTAAILLSVPLLFPEFFGLPLAVTKILGGIAFFFAIYSLINHLLFNAKNWKPFMQAIAIANTIYCALSFGVVIWHYQEVTGIGWIYFIGEISIILLLVLWEFRAVKKFNQQ